MPSSAATHLPSLSLHDALPISAPFSSKKSLLRLSWPGIGLTITIAAPRASVSDVVNPPGLLTTRSATAISSSIWSVKPSTLTRCRSEEHTSELQSLRHLVCRLLLLPTFHPFPYTTLFRSRRRSPARSRCCDSPGRGSG